MRRAEGHAHKWYGKSRGFVEKNRIKWSGISAMCVQTLLVLCPLPWVNTLGVVVVYPYSSRHVFDGL